jgi:hypothetical protein
MNTTMTKLGFYEISFVKKRKRTSTNLNLEKFNKRTFKKTIDLIKKKDKLFFDQNKANV